MKLAPLLEAPDRAFVLKFQQDMVDLGWDTRLERVNQALALHFKKNKGRERKMWAFQRNEKPCMVFMSKVYFYSAQEFADYAYEHKLESTT